MAALAALPVRSSPPLSSSTSSSKKQENSAAVAAGRRRLDEYRRRKVDKGKKISAPDSSNEQPQSVAEEEQKPALPATGDSSASPYKSSESNGYVSKDAVNESVYPVSMFGSSTVEVAMVSGKNRERATPSVLGTQLSTEGQVREDPDLKAMSSGGMVNDASSRGASHSNAFEQPIMTLSGTVSGKAERGSDSLPGLDSRTRNRVAVPKPPLGATDPVSVPAPPAIQGLSDPVHDSTGQGKSEPMKNPASVNPPFFQTSSSRVSRSSSNHTSQRANGANVVMLDSKLVPNRIARDGHLPHLLEQEGESTSSAKSRSASTSAPPSERMRIGEHTDGINSASAASPFFQSTKAISLNVNSEIDNKSVYSDVNTPWSTLASSSKSQTSLKVSESFALEYSPVSESAASKFLPLPPPLFRPPISNYSLKPEPFLHPVFNNTSNSGSSASSDTLSPALPSTTNFFDEALLRPSAPISSQFPSPMSAISAAHEKDKSEFPSVPSTTIVFSRSPVSVGDFPVHSIKAVESLDQSLQLRPQSFGGDDFAMLEQHIEDLTRDKFSLHRGLTEARLLAETLAQENTALTEDYNNQGALVNDLKTESERQTAEIRAQAVVVKNMKAEKDKAVQERSAAVERSQALAAEVIDLEEKVLRARSQELKLQREVELLGAEIESQNRQILSLDKDRANLNSLVEALQEEKGLLQSQVRKAAVGGHSADARRASYFPATVAGGVHAKADACTSTDDFEWRPSYTPGPRSTTVPYSASQNQRIMGSLAGRGLNLGPLSSVIPPDQSETIDNINKLITELAEEKEALLKTLRAESVGAAELRNLNAELSHKLEVQTQRLELAVAQSMAHGASPRLQNMRAVTLKEPQYVDEGDEVVDRVLGWIMQLFPSGSSRRKGR